MGTSDVHKPISKLVSLLILSLVIASPAASTERPDIKFLIFPYWTLGNQAMTPGGATIEEYTPPGQTVLDWRELFTWQYFPNWPGQATPRAIMDDLKRIRVSQNPKTEWKIITTTKDSIIYEWKVRKSGHDEYVPGIGDYYEIARIVLGTDGIYIFRYTTKKADFSLHDRREWARTLKKIELISK
jgi:uncharacterized protein YihD (DUF1040 family)